MCMCVTCFLVNICIKYVIKCSIVSFLTLDLSGNTSQLKRSCLSSFIADTAELCAVYQSGGRQLCTQSPLPVCDAGGQVSGLP